MADRCAADLSRMKNLIGKSWNSWNLPETATEHDLKKMRAQFKPKETKIPLEFTNPLPTELMYLYGSRPESDLFSLTQCPACKKYYKTQWMNNHFIKNAANEHLCKTTGIVVGTSQVKKKKIVKRGHESRRHNRYRSSHEHHRHRSKKSHHSHSGSKKRSSLTYVSEKKHKDRSPSKPKSKEKEKIVEDKRHKEKSSSKRHSSPKDRRVSNPTSYTLSIPDDKDENIPVKVLLSNKKSNKQENKPSLQIISEKPSKISRSVSSEKIKIHKESTDKKSKSSSGSIHSSHKHKKTTSSHGNSDHSPSPTKANLKEDYKFKIPLKSKSSDSRSQSFDSIKTKDSSKYKSHSSEDISTTKGKDVSALPKVAYRSTSNILSNSNIPNKHSSTNSSLSSLKISLQNISPSMKASSGSEPDISAVAKGISSKSYSKEKFSTSSAVLSPKHSAPKGTTPTKSSSSKSASSNASIKTPPIVTSSKSNVTILNSKLALSLLSPDSKLSSLSKSSSSLTIPKQSPPVSVSKLSSNKSSASLSRSTSSIKSSSSSSSSSSKSSSLSPSKFSTATISKSSTKALTIISPKASPVTIAKTPSLPPSKSISSTPSSKSTILTSAKMPVTSLSPSKSSSSKSQSSSKSSKSHVPSVKTTPGSNIIMTSSSVKSTSLPSNTLSSSSDSLSNYDMDAPYIRAEIRVATTASSKLNTEVSGKYLPTTSTKDKKSSKSNSSVVESVSTKQISSTKDKKHSGKHGSSSSHSSVTIESKSLSSDKQPSSKEKKSSSKSSSSVTATLDTKPSKTTPPAAAKKSNAYNSSLTSPTNYKALSVSPPQAFPSALPPAYIVPSWTSAFKNSLAQSQSAAKSSSLASSIQSSSSYSMAGKNSYPNIVHKSPMIASTSSAIQSTIITPSTTQLGDRLGAKMHTLGLPTTPTLPEVPPQVDKLEPKQSHHKKKKKKKDRDYQRKIIPLKDRCFHPDQHCGVVVAPSVMPCKRSLTCKTHSIALRRAVAGRSSSFDSLLAAHKKARDEEKMLTKTEKRDTLVPPEAPAKKELYAPIVDPPVVHVPVPKPVEVPAPAPILVELDPECVEIIPSPDSKENEVPEDGENDSIGSEPEIVYVKELPLEVIDAKEIKDGTSLYEVPKLKEDRMYTMGTTSFKCLSTNEFNKKCQSMKRKISKVEDCLVISPKKVLVDKEKSDNSTNDKINFVNLRLEKFMPKPPVELSDEETSKDEETPTTKSAETEQEEEVTIVGEVYRKPGDSPRTAQQIHRKQERLVRKKSMHKVVRSLRDRQAARRLTAINQALFADNCTSHKMYLISKESEMAKLALKANDIERAKRHLTVKKIMAAKDPLSFTARRVAKWLVKSNLGLLKKGSMFTSSHKLVEKCVLDRKQFLSKQYMLIRKQLQNRERVKARKRVMKCYRQAIRRNLLTSKKKLGIRQKLAADKQKKLDKHFKLNVYRNLRRIRKHLLKKQLKSLRIALLRRAHYSRKKHLALQKPKRRNTKFPNGKKRVSLAQNRMVTKKFLLSEKNSLNRSLARSNDRNIVKSRSDQVTSKEKPPVSDIGKKISPPLKSTDGIIKPRVITVIMSVSKATAASLLQKSSSKSKDVTNSDKSILKEVDPNEFRKLIESRLAANKKNNSPGANAVAGVSQHKPLILQKMGQNSLPNKQLITARDILALHKKKAESLNQKIVFGHSYDFDEKELSALTQAFARCRTMSRPEPSLLQNSKSKGQTKPVVETNLNEKSKTSPRKNSSKTAERNVKGREGKTKLNRTLSPVAEENEKVVSNGSRSNSFTASQPGTPSKSKPKTGLGKNLSSPSKQNVSPGVSTTPKGDGKNADVGGGQKTVTKPKPLKADTKKSSEPKSCKYRLVSQNLKKNVVNSVIPDNIVPGKKGTKVSNPSKTVASAANVEAQNTVANKSQLKSKNGKVESVKKNTPDIIVGQGSGLIVSGGNKINRPMNTKPPQQLLSKTSPNKTGTTGKIGKETNVVNSSSISITQVMGKYSERSCESRGSRISTGEVPPSNANAPCKTSNGDSDQQKRLMLTLAVQRLISEKKISGDKRFSEQESKLIKLYLKYQSTESKNALIANCILTQKTPYREELAKKIMAGSALSPQ